MPQRHAFLIAIALLTMGSPFLATPLHADDAATSNVEESWQVIIMQGQRVGYQRSRTWEKEVDGQKRLWSDTLNRLTFKRFGATLTMTVKQLTEETEAGSLLSFVYEADNPPASHTKTIGRIEGDTLKLTTTAAGQTRETSEPWDAEVKSPAYQERLLAEDPIKPGESRSFRSFEPQLLKVGTITIKGKTPGKTQLLDGSEPTLDRFTMTSSLIPGMEMTLYVDAEGETLRSDMNLLQLVTYTVSRDEALKEISGQELDFAISTLIKVSPIKNAHRRQQIVYEMKLDPSGLALSLPEGPTQQVEVIDPRTLRITVTSIKPVADTRQAAVTIEDKYLRTSRSLQSEHPAVIKLAQAAAGDVQDPVEMAVAMEKYVHKNLRSKNFSSAMATAAEVATTLEGDCTEHAMLLASMLRVKGIPSRVVVGLVYAESLRAFGGHMWTEAYLGGRWVPLDATLGLGRIGVGHIKFADTSLADSAPAAATAFVPLMGVLDRMTLRVVDPRGGER